MDLVQNAPKMHPKCTQSHLIAPDVHPMCTQSAPKCAISCDQCNIVFTRKSSLIRHKKKNCKEILKQNIESQIIESPVNEVPIIGTSVNEVPIIEISVIEVPIIETSVNEVPIIEVPVIKTSVNEVPIIETPIVESSVIETPIVESQIIETPITETLISYYNCKYCDKSIKHSYNLNRHELVCKKKKDDNNIANGAMEKLVDLLNNQLQEQNQQMKAQIEAQNAQIQELIKKAGINNSNIINTINNHNNITLAYDKTSTAHLTDADYMRCINRYTRCIPQLVKQIHFNPDATENNNIYISGIKNNFVMLYNGEKWLLTDRTDTIMKLINDKEGLIEQKLFEWEESGHKNYPVAMEKFNKYLDQRDSDFVMNRTKKDIKLMLFNNRDIANSNVPPIPPDTI